MKNLILNKKMKAIIKFKLPEEQSEFDMFNQSSSMFNVLWEMHQYLRSKTKYATEDTTEDTYNAFEDCRDAFNQLLNENNIDLWK